MNVKEDVEEIQSNYFGASLFRSLNLQAHFSSNKKSGPDVAFYEKTLPKLVPANPIRTKEVKRKEKKKNLLIIDLQQVVGSQT